MPGLEDIGSILEDARVAVLAVRLTDENVLGGWVVFQREHLARAALPVPPAELVAPGVARLRLAARGVPASAAITAPDAAVHLELRLPAASDERFVGFGERFNAVNQRGRKLEVWCDEGAIGLGEKQATILALLGAKVNPFPKGATTAYKPLPWFLSPQQRI